MIISDLDHLEIVSAKTNSNDLEKVSGAIKITLDLEALAIGTKGALTIAALRIVTLSKSINLLG